MITPKAILIANRGEIAIRIMRTATALGYRTVAVYSDADAHAPHVGMADQAVHIGPAPVGDSYLNGERILAAAKEAGAGAIHPGYGFLAENAQFVRACEESSVSFIGPNAEAVEIMGNKAAAKRRMAEVGVPCVPGYQGKAQTDKAFIEAANEIGFPVMVKAAAGGGGRGMRLVTDESDLAAALKGARSEAANAFGCGELIIEKAIMHPRHVEIQLIADSHGEVVHLGERDCSVQRRHQKVVEEAPCPIMTGKLRARMGEAAVEAARSISYVGAGTVEFLLDSEGTFYFLEMNTRLQVEHPVTELVTGLDLVALQIAIAEGEPLGFSQADVVIDGHAIEARLYAEDPAMDFLPSTGQVTQWRPFDGEGVRIDGGIATGMEISPLFDPMLAKIIAHGQTRDQARRRLTAALRNTVLFGLPTNQSVLIDILENPVFAAGGATTDFIERQIGEVGLKRPAPGFEHVAVAAIINYCLDRDNALALALSNQHRLTNWSSAGRLITAYRYDTAVGICELTVSPLDDTCYDVRSGNDRCLIELTSWTNGTAVLRLGGRKMTVFAHMARPGELALNMNGQIWNFRNLIGLTTLTGEQGGGGRVVAPMHGRLLDVLVKPGDAVKEGTRLVVMEAMKMQHEIMADVEGTVATVHHGRGDQVVADELLIEIDIVMT